MSPTLTYKNKNPKRWASAYLDDEGFVLEARREAHHAHVGRLVDEVLDPVENSTAGGRDATVDSSLTDGFSCHTRMSVDVLRTHARRIRLHFLFMYKHSTDMDQMLQKLNEWWKLCSF